MNWRYMAIFGVLMVFGLAFATPYNATNDPQSYYARWQGSSAAQAINIEGGNVSDLNLSATSLTDRWAAFFGNLTGTIYLTTAAGGTTSYVYRWAVGTTFNSGYVCASNSPAFNFLGANPASAANINTAFNHGNAADNATNTLTGTCTLQFAGQGPIQNAPAVDTGNIGADTFRTCAITDGTNYAFCVAADAAGTNFLGSPADYELMVPTVPGTGLTTYYFYAELA